MSNRDRVGPAVGLLIAWGGTALLVSPLAARLGASSLLIQSLGQAALWLLFAVIVGIVILWEKRSLASLWLKPFHWHSFIWAGLLVAGTIVLLFPATEWVRNAAGLPSYAATMEKMLVLPIWFRTIAAVTAGIVEETLFRGYAVTRLVQLTGSLWVTTLISSLVFAALHLPVWGPGPSLYFLIVGLVYTAFFIWRRDLFAMIIAHVALDAWGLAITPLYSQWWK